MSCDSAISLNFAQHSRFAASSQRNLQVHDRRNGLQEPGAESFASKQTTLIEKHVIVEQDGTADASSLAKLPALFSTFTTSSFTAATINLSVLIISHLS